MKKLFLLFFLNQIYCPPIPDWENSLYILLKEFFKSRSANKLQVKVQQIPKNSAIDVDKRK